MGKHIFFVKDPVTLTAENAALKAETDKNTGLSSKEAKRRMIKYGQNVIGVHAGFGC